MTLLRSGLKSPGHAPLGFESAGKTSKTGVRVPGSKKTEEELLPVSPLSPREAFEVFQSEIQQTESLERSSDLSPRPGQQHTELGGRGIRVDVKNAQGRAEEGLLLRASKSGLVVRVPEPLAFRSVVLAEWIAFGGYTMAFAGHVIRTSEDEMAIRFELQSEHDATFLSSFVQMADSEDSDALRLSIRQVRDDDASLNAAEQTRRLEQAWAHLEPRFGQDGAHQAFIQTCLRMQRIDFALDRYRDSLERPQLRQAAQTYMDQLGKILTFSGFIKREEAPNKPRQRAMWLLVAGAFLFLLLVGLRFAASRANAPPAPLPSTTPR